MKNLFLALLAKLRRSVASTTPQPEASKADPTREFTLVTTDSGDEIFLHDGDLITVDRSFVGFAVEVAMLRPKRFHALPIAHCTSLREAEILRAVLVSKLATKAERFDVRRRARFVNGQLTFQEAKHV